MADFINPVPCFWDLVHVFEDGAEAEAGIAIDQNLCRIMADVLIEAAEGVAQLVEFARAHGRVETIEPDAAPARTPVQRQQLARLAIALDPGARIVAFPQAPVRTFAASEGGSAA